MKYKLLLIIFIVFTFLAVFFIFFSRQKSLPPIPVIIQNITPTPTSLPISIILPEESQDLVVGKTTENEIKQLPDIKNITDLPNQQTQFSLISPRVNRDNEIITQNNIVVFSRIIAKVKNNKLPSLSEFKSKYGEPEKEISGSNYYGKVFTTYIYGSNGITLIANPYSDEIYEVHNFSPMSADQYIQTWGEDLRLYEEGPAGI